MAEQCRVCIATSQDLVKTLKTALEQSQQFDRSLKILKVCASSVNQYIPMLPEQPPSGILQYLIPTKITTSLGNAGNNSAADALLTTLGLSEYERGRFAILLLDASCKQRASSSTYNNPVRRAVHAWLKKIPDIPRSMADELLDAESWSYQTYTPLLLLGPATFSSQPWRDLCELGLVTRILPELYKSICFETNCTHLAINAPISLYTKTRSEIVQQPNILRSPSGLITLHGDFGNGNDKPSETSFPNAFWVSVLQNRIYQIYAPLHTMFSRGNIKEKARVIQIAGAEHEAFTAVDLYTGIGYFAFSYAQGGAELVLGWEINGWSVEGFQRGAGRNGWSCIKYRHHDSISGSDLTGRGTPEQAAKPRLAVFEESNEFAASRIDQISSSIPPVRHVNCGYLPSSLDSWDTAIYCLDPDLGGCIHAHENVADKDIGNRTLEIEQVFRELIGIRFGKNGTKVYCEHVEQVKSYAPGVVHCVFDVRISPMSPGRPGSRATEAQILVQD